jgi:hypothetical protein
MPSETDIAVLIVKYLREELTGEEKQALVSWLQQSRDHQEFLQTFLTKERLLEKLKVFSEMDERRIWEKLMNLIK